MRLVLIVLLLIACGRAGAQDRILGVAPQAHELAPLQACLSKAITDAKPSSDDAALAIAQTACADEAATARLKMIDANARHSGSTPPSYGDPVKAIDGAILVTRTNAYWDFTGHRPRFCEEIQNAADVCPKPCTTWAGSQPDFKTSFDQCVADCRKQKQKSCSDQ